MAWKTVEEYPEVPDSITGATSKNDTRITRTAHTFVIAFVSCEWLEAIADLAGAAAALGRADGLEEGGGVPRGPRLDHRGHEQERHENHQNRPYLRHRFRSL